MRAKPIFIVRVPIETEKEFQSSLCKNLKKEFSEYHILVVSGNTEEINFECFYEKDMNEIKFEELKDIVRNQLK